LRHAAKVHPEIHLLALECWILKQLVNTLDNELVFGMAFVREVWVVMLLVLCNGTKERWE
jgi:hypothetical protein